MQEFRDRLLPQLSAKSHDCVRLARCVQVFVDEAGKEATARRERLRIVVSFVEEFLRGLLRTRVGNELVGDESLVRGGARSDCERLVQYDDSDHGSGSNPA